MKALQPMTHTFLPVRLEELAEIYAAYRATLSSPFDSFLEDRILRSRFFAIRAGEATVGFFAILQAEQMLTHFFLTKPSIRQGQHLFARILAEHTIARAFVSSGDELFLSHAVDKMNRLAVQAYFFQDGGSKASGYGDGATTGVPVEGVDLGAVRPAHIGDIAAIVSASGDFFDQLAERIERGEIFVLEDAGVLAGIGIIESGRLLPETASIGMFTAESARGKGVGRTLLQGLKAHCLSRGKVPLAGCWVGNYASKRTLEAAGMVTKTRLFHITFSEAGQ